MILNEQTIVQAVTAIIALRNQCKQAIQGNEQVIEVPGVPAATLTDGSTRPGKPAWKKSTGQLPNAANNLFVAATNLIGHLRNIAPGSAEIAALEKALNAPVTPVTPAQGTQMTQGTQGVKAPVTPMAGATPVSAAAK